MQEIDQDDQHGGDTHIIRDSQKLPIAREDAAYVVEMIESEQNQANGRGAQTCEHVEVGAFRHSFKRQDVRAKAELIRQDQCSRQHDGIQHEEAESG
jgi:hypothetical protein